MLMNSNSLVYITQIQKKPQKVQDDDTAIKSTTNNVCTTSIMGCTSSSSSSSNIVTTTVDASSDSSSTTFGSILSIFGRFLRIITLDIPLFIILLSYASLLWLGHVHVSYLRPQLQAVLWTDQRSDEEITYYKRTCTADDITTLEGADLFLPYNATPEEAYQHQLKHGFTVFRHVLQPQTATNLRTFIDSRNRKLREEEKIFVIAGDNRYSFGLGTEEPSVVQALKEIGNSPTLRPALEKILGPDPALIEMTAITSSYGAVAQYWHDDVVAAGSAINFARTFGPSYSVFVQLQNTTKQMGATGTCPGTHYCSEGAIEEFCDQYGFQLVDGDNGYWGIGDALLMNMNSVHRGAAHTDPNGMDRVMLILTFVPKPIKRAESRQMSQGITFSLRWDMWGHTLSDLANADTAMSQPWATLRALGLYKSPKASWGVDYISGSSMRMANADNGFRQDELETWVKEWGGFKFLPSWLEGEVDFENESWHEYLQHTHELCTEFLEFLSVVAVVGYLCFFALISVATFRKKRQHGGLSCFVAAVGRILFISGSVGLLFYWAKQHVDNSGWASDIKEMRRYASTTRFDRVAFMDEEIDWESSPSTLPNKYDVLVETRYGSEQLAMYNDFINGHPGNRYFRDMVKESSRSFTSYPRMFQYAAAEYILESVALAHGRFLFQAPDGHWLWMTHDDSMNYIRNELASNTTPLLKNLMLKLRYMRSEYKYGIFRSSALAWHASRYVQHLERKLLSTVTKDISKATSNFDSKPKAVRVLYTKFKIPILSSKARRVPRQFTLHSDESSIMEPTKDAWLSADDLAESYEDGFWYLGIIRSVNAHGVYSLDFPNGEKSDVDQYDIRFFHGYTQGETVEVFFPKEDEFFEGRVVTPYSNDEKLEIHIEELDEVLEFDAVPNLLIRRVGEKEKTKQVFDSGYH